MRKLFISLILLASCMVLAKDVQNSFSASSLSGLRKAATVFEYDGTVDVSGNLLDTGGKHNLTPANSPTTVLSTFQSASGNQFQARYFTGTSSQRYYKSNFTEPQFYTGNSTVTIVFMVPSSSTFKDKFIMQHMAANSGFGVYFDADFGLLTIRYYRSAGGSKTQYYPTTLSDDKYHILQITRKSDILMMYVDGVAMTPVYIAGYGTDAGSTTLSLGSSSAATQFFTGSILYARGDSEALSTAQLARDREIIRGRFFGSGNLPSASTFSRSTTATKRFSNGTLDYVAANVPRVSGDGGGVLIEEGRTNYALQSQTFGTTWTQVALTSISSDGAQAPDLTTTADGLVGTAVDTLHGVTQVVNLTGSANSFSVYAKPGNKNWIYLSNDTIANASIYCNVSTCAVGTVGASVEASGAERFANSWCRCFFKLNVPLGGANTYKIASANADADNDFAGDAATVNTWLWGAQVEAGHHPTSYSATTTTTVSKNGDSLSIEPWRISKQINLDNPMCVMYFDNDIYATGTYTSEIGNYTFTASGDIKHIESQTLNDYFSCDGTGDYLKLANGSGGSDFNFASSGANASFSIVIIATPDTVSGTHRIMSKTASAPNSGWNFYQNNATIILSTSYDGTNATNNTTGNLLETNKTSLITVTYSYSGTPNTNTSTSNIYIDGNAVVTSNVMAGPVNQSTADLGVGASGTGSIGYSGKIHYLAFYKGRVITQAEHNALYGLFKEEGLLPLSISATAQAKKLLVEFDYRSLFSSSSDIGLFSRHVFSISGNTGTAASNKNYISFFVDTSGQSNMSLYTNESTTQRTYTSAAMTTYNQWHKYALTYDFSDLSKSTFYIDGASAMVSSSNMSGTDQSLVLKDTLIRVGQRYDNTTQADGRIRNLRIQALP